MKQSEELRELLHSIHRKSYPAYKGLKGIYDFRTYRLSIDHVQGDPFASPSSISVRIWRERAGFPDTYLKEDFQRTALADFLTRQFSAAISRFNFRAKGSGKSGLLSTSSCSQEILKRIEAGELDTMPLITHVFPLREIDRAYEVFEEKRGGVMKIAIRTEDDKGGKILGI